MAERRLFDISFKRGEPLHDGSDYVITGPGGETSGGLAVPLSEGGSGQIYRSIYKGRLPRAIKILNPRRTRNSIDYEHFTQTFEAEISMLSELRHTHLVKILDFGDFESQDRVVKYFVMEYIEGIPLGKLWADPSCNEQVVLDVLYQVLQALQYLHDRRILHFDVKEDNIFVTREGHSWSATLLDLGVAKHVPNDDDRLFTKADLSDETYIFSTRRIMRDERKELLGGRISRSELRSWFPDQDLFAFGLILSNLLADTKRPKAVERLGQAGINALKNVRDRLHQPPDNLYYLKPAHVSRDLKKLERGYLSPLGVPELSLAANTYTAIATASGRVGMTERLYQVFNHRFFQRLRNIPQLEFDYLVYPGARHSRLHHSLNTFEIAREYVLHMLNDSKFRLQIEPAQIEGVLLRALLHDIGHFPLSHMFEDVAEEHKLRGAEPDILTDDDLFWSFVAPDRPDLADRVAAAGRVVMEELKVREAGKATHLADVIRESFSDDALQWLDRLGPGRGTQDPVLTGILDAPIDADKVAYLQDDSLMSGVKYGLGIDLDALFSALRSPLDDDLKRAQLPTLAISEKGLPAAEGIVLARYWMLKRVYWHHTNRAVMAMIKFAIDQLTRGDRFNFQRYLRQTLFSTEVEALGVISRDFESAIADDQLQEERKVTNPLQGIQQGARHLYKRLLSLPYGPSETDRRIYESLSARSEQIIGLRDIILQTIEAKMGWSRTLSASDVLIDVPIRKREESGGQVLVYLRRDATRGRDLMSREVSPLLSTLREEFDFHVKKARVYIHPELRARIGDSLDDVIAAVEVVVRRWCLE